MLVGGSGPFALPLSQTLTPSLLVCGGVPPFSLHFRLSSSDLLWQGPNPLASKKKTLKKAGAGGVKLGGGAKRGASGPDGGVADSADGGEGKIKRRRRRKSESEGQGKPEGKEAE